MRRLSAYLTGAALVLTANAGLAQERAAAACALDRWIGPTLTPFTSESELRRYLRAVRRLDEARAPSARRIQLAHLVQSETQADVEPPLCQSVEECPPVEDGAENIIVTGASRSSNPSITNNQEAGVDEGDIVKQVGQFLLVLQDGRVFSIDTRPGDSPGLALADRADVYRSAAEDTWYDEMLVSDDRVLITGYSYREDATELVVFRVGPAGQLTREGVFFLSSNDYYDTENYATRVVDGRLVVYTPIDISDLGLDDKIEWPVVRRWEPEQARSQPARGRPLLGARDIYRPVRAVSEPFLHTVSICPLGSAGGGRTLECRTTGFIDARDREFHVSPTDAFLWITDWDSVEAGTERTIECGAGYRAEPDDSVAAVLFRLPLASDPPAVLGVRGDPIDYLSLDTGAGRFRALTRWPSRRCEDRGPFALTLFDVPLGRFQSQLREAPARSYTAMPTVGTGSIENRFTDDHLVYGGRRGWSSYPPDEPLEGDVSVAAVPLSHPGDAQVLQVPHSILRVEQAGRNVVLTGYRDDSALDVSFVDLSAAPRIASTVRLAGRYESEGRSHAFNSLIEETGNGLMGLPTTHREERSGRWWSYSDASDVSFLSVDSGGRLAPLGELVAHENGPDRDKEGDGIDEDGTAETYQCEVSCIDWYGNSRPVFTDGRVFALAGAELIEGQVENGRVREIRRLNITLEPRR